MSGSGEIVDQVTGELRDSAFTRKSPRVDSRERSRFRLGVAGYDLWPHAINFCRVLRDAEFLDISAVWDEDPRKLERLVDLTGAKGYSDLDSFSNSSIDGAVITARTSLRCAIAKQLAAAGKHVLSDKPMAMNADEGRQIIAACNDAGVVLMGGYNFRFWKVWPLMKRILDNGELGEPFHYYCAYNTGMIRRTEWDSSLDSDWTDPAATPGGGWLTHGDHAIDLVRWLSGAEFVDVLADMRKLRHPEFDVEDYGIAHYTLSNGATALIHSDAISDTVRLDFTVACPKGGMAYSIYPEPRLKVWGAPSLGAEIVEYSIDENWVDALGHLTEAFVEAIETGTTPQITGVDNMRVMEVVDATYQSAREGRTVQIHQAPAE